MKRLRIYFIALLFFGVACAETKQEKETKQLADTLVFDYAKVPKAEMIHNSEVQPEPTLIDSLKIFFKGKGYELVPQLRWNSGYRALSRDSTYVVRMLVSDFEKAIRVVNGKHRVVNNQLHAKSIRGMVFREKQSVSSYRVDFKFLMMEYADPVALQADLKNVREYSHYVLHAKSGIKHPNHFFVHQNYVFYFQTRAAMFSGRVRELSKSLKEELE